MQGSTSARDESDSYIADGDEHDPSMERSSGVVAASTLRLFERNTQQQQSDTLLQGGSSLEALSEIGPHVPVVSPCRASTGRTRSKGASQADSSIRSPSKVIDNTMKKAMCSNSSSQRDTHRPG